MHKGLFFFSKSNSSWNRRDKNKTQQKCEHRSNWWDRQCKFQPSELYLQCSLSWETSALVLACRPGTDTVVHERKEGTCGAGAGTQAAGNSFMCCNLLQFRGTSIIPKDGIRGALRSSPAFWHRVLRHRPHPEWCLAALLGSGRKILFNVSTITFPGVIYSGMLMWLKSSGPCGLWPGLFLIGVWSGPARDLRCRCGDEWMTPAVATHTHTHTHWPSCVRHCLCVSVWIQTHAVDDDLL